MFRSCGRRSSVLVLASFGSCPKLRAICFSNSNRWTCLSTYWCALKPCAGRGGNDEDEGADDDADNEPLMLVLVVVTALAAHQTSK